MPGVTKVGPPERGDQPKKRNLFWRVSEWYLRRFDKLLNWARSPAPGKDGLATHLTLGDDKRDPSHGLPEADLTDDQREAAVRRIQDEEAIRRARGQ